MEVGWIAALCTAIGSLITVLTTQVLRWRNDRRSGAREYGQDERKADLKARQDERKVRDELEQKWKDYAARVDSDLTRFRREWDNSTKRLEGKLEKCQESHQQCEQQLAQSRGEVQHLRQEVGNLRQEVASLRERLGQVEEGETQR
jgi:chromosome segregation ATPase